MTLSLWHIIAGIAFIAILTIAVIFIIKYRCIKNDTSKNGSKESLDFNNESNRNASKDSQSDSAPYTQFDVLLESLKNDVRHLSNLESVKGNTIAAQAPEDTDSNEDAFSLNCGGPQLSQRIEDVVNQLTNKYVQIQKSNASINAQLANKQKEIDDLEEQLIEAQDEASKNKKQYKREHSELLSLTIQKEELDDSYKRLSSDFECQTIELNESNAALSSCNEALAFANKIINAPNDDDRDAIEWNRRIDIVYDFILNDYLDVYRRLKYFNKDDVEVCQTKIWQWQNLQKKTWIQGKKVVALVGEFSAGKTSIINRLLSQDCNDAPKLPTNSGRTTAIATYISYGIDFRSRFTTPSGGVKQISKETFESVNKEMLSAISVTSLIHNFVLSYNNPNLRQLSLLDTPGFSSNDEGDEQQTIDVIRESDLLFWVIDVNTGTVNKSSLEIIGKHLRDIPLYIILNKCDDKSEEGRNIIEQDVRKKLAENNINIQGVIHFSKSEAVDVLLSAINSVEVSNNKDNVIQELYSDLRSRLQQKYKSKKDEQKKLTECSKETRDTLGSISNDLRSLCDNCDELGAIPEENSRWFKENDYRMSKSGYYTFSRLVSDIESQGRNVSDQVKDLDHCSKEEQKQHDVVSQIKEDCKNLEDLQKRFDIVLKQWKNNAIEEFSTNTPVKDDSSIESISNNDSIETNYIREISFISQDKGGFTKEDESLIVGLASGYGISKKKALSLAKPYMRK